MIFNIVCAVLWGAIVISAYVIGLKRGYRHGYWEGRKLGHALGRRAAVTQAEIGIDDGLERTDLPRPDAPAAVVSDVDYRRERIMRTEDWEGPWA